MAMGSGIVLTYTILVVMSLKPWWEAQYVIPMVRSRVILIRGGVLQILLPYKYTDKYRGLTIVEFFIERK